MWYNKDVGERSMQKYYSSSNIGALFLCPKITMPYRSKKPCSSPGCGELVDVGNTYCRKHRKKYFEKDRQKRGTASSRGYSSRWRRVSRLYLKKNPLCAQCLTEGRVVPAEVVDHIVPHRGDYKLFWDSSNWQGLCTLHHNRKIGKEKIIICRGEGG